MTVRFINPRRDRHISNTKKLITSAVRCVGNVADNDVLSGFILITWDSQGATSCSTLSGGGISEDIMPIHATNTLSRME
jgi:hypothetical protein